MDASRQLCDKNFIDLIICINIKRIIFNPIVSLKKFTKFKESKIAERFLTCRILIKKVLEKKYH